jgi:hypothetical protein
MKDAQMVLTEHGLQNSVWGLRIIDWEKTTVRDSKALSEAFSWVDCACGKLDPRIPRWTGLEPDFRDSYGAKSSPKDKILNDLGVDFATIWEKAEPLPTSFLQWDNTDVDSLPLYAAECLVRIEQRAAEILAGMK